MIRPTSNLLLLRPLAAPTVSAGGIVIPSGAMEDASARATVVAIGPGKRNSVGQLQPLDVQVGDTVLLLRFHLAHEEVVVDGETYSLVAEPDLWGIVDEEEG